MAKNVLVFTMLFDGIPMVYQGQEQHLDGDGTPNNREAIWLTKYDTGAPLYKLIGKLNRIRKHAYSLEEDYLALSTHTIFQGGSELAFMKGVEGQQVMMVLSTQNSTSQHYSLHLPFSYNAGTTVTDVLNCNNYTVDDDGVLEIDMDKGEPRVFFPTRHMNGSGLCGYDVPHNSFQSANSTSDATSPFLGITHVKEAGLTLFILAVTNMFRLLF